MERSDIVNKVGIALQDCITAKGIKISEYFTREEILDFANTIVAYLPENYEYRFTEIEQDVFEHIADKEECILKLVKYFANKTSLNITYTSNGLIEDNNKIIAYLHHLVFTSLMLLKINFNIDVDKALDDIVNYYKSLVLTADDLKENVRTVIAPGITTTANINSTTCVRIDNENNFIPTIKTIKNFKHLTLKDYGDIA